MSAPKSESDEIQESFLPFEPGIDYVWLDDFGFQLDKQVP
jgi:hypothetical protein